MTENTEFDEITKSIKWIDAWITLKEGKILYEACLRLNVKTIVELGTGNGTSTKFLALAVKQTGGHVYTCDKNDDKIQWGLTHNVEEQFVELNLSKYTTFYVRDDLDVAKMWANFNLPIDFLFIDTAHSYSQTLRELLAFMPFLSEKGECYMHDVNHLAYGAEFDKAIKEFLEKYPRDNPNKPRIFKYELINTPLGLGRFY